MNIASDLAYEDRDYLKLAKNAYEISSEIEAEILADFAMAYYKFKDYSIAKDFFVKALESTPNNPKWLHLLAHSYEESNDLKSALIYMGKAALVDKKYLNCLANIHHSLHNVNAAIDCYKKALDDNSNNERAWNNLGAIYLQRNEYNNSIECYEKAVAIKPNLVSSLRGLARSWWDCQNRDYKKTKEYALKAVEIDDNDAESLYLLGASSYMSADLGQAKLSLEKSIELSPTNCMPYRYLQDIYEQANDTDSQINCFKKLIEIHPQEIWSYYKLGLIYKWHREYKLAKKYLMKASELDSKSEPKMNQLAKEELKIVKLMLKLESSKLDEKDIKSLTANEVNQLAYDLIGIGQFEKADLLLATGIQNAPDFSYLHATSGLSCFKQGKIIMGKELYLKSIAMSPDDNNLKQKYHYEYGKALRIDGKFDEALQELHNALQTDSKYIIADEIKLEIQKAQQFEGDLKSGERRT